MIENTRILCNIHNLLDLHEDFFYKVQSHFYIDPYRLHLNLRFVINENFLKSSKNNVSKIHILICKDINNLTKIKIKFNKYLFKNNFFSYKEMNYQNP